MCFLTGWSGPYSGTPSKHLLQRMKPSAVLEAVLHTAVTHNGESCGGGILDFNVLKARSVHLSVWLYEAGSIKRVLRRGRLEAVSNHAAPFAGSESTWWVNTVRLWGCSHRLKLAELCSLDVFLNDSIFLILPMSQPHLQNGQSCTLEN